MIDLYKIIKPKATGLKDLSLTIINQQGEKFVITITNLDPYCFVSRDQRINVPVITFEDDKFINLNGEKMLTILTDSQREIKQLKHEVDKKHKGIIFQGDISFDLASLIKMGTLRYCLLETNDVIRGEISAENVQAPTKQQIVTAKFPNFVKRFVDTEFILEDGSFNIDDIIKGYGTCVCVVVDYNLYLLADRDYENFTHLLYGKEINVKTFPDQKTLIKAVYDDINSGHIAIAWNSKFDREALENTAKHIGLNLNWDTVQWLDIQKSFIANLGISSPFISLKEAFDVVFYFNRDNWKKLPDIFQKYYSLDEYFMPQLHTDSKIYKYLNWRKTTKGGDVYNLYTTGQIKKLMFYNASDVLDMIALDVISGVNGFISQFDALGVTNIDHVFVHSWKIEPTPLLMAYINKIASPSMDKTRPRKEGLEGGLVHPASIGIVHEDVFISDFSRFYISLIISKLISPENPPAVKNKAGELIYQYPMPKGPSRDPPKKLITILPDGTKLDKPMFFLEALAYYLIQTREEAEQGYINATSEEEKAYYENLKKSFKTLTSGLWGYISHNTGRYYADHVAYQILQEARDFNMLLKDYVNNNDIYCYDGGKPLRFITIYGDTDSAFFKPIKKVDRTLIDIDVLNEHLNKFLKSVCDSRGYKVPIQAKVENLLSKMNMLGKKNYYGLTVWKENVGWLEEAEFIMKGVAAKKQNFSSFSKDFQFAVMNFHLRFGMQGIRKVVQKYRAEFKKGVATLKKKVNFRFLESVAKPITFKKSFDFYRYKTDKDGKFLKDDEGNKIPKKPTAYSYWCDAAEEWNKYILNKDEYITEGTKAYSLPIKSAFLPRMTLNKYLVFTNANLIDWEKVKLDLPLIEDLNLKDKINKILLDSGFKKDEVSALMQGRVNADLSDLI